MIDGQMLILTGKEIAGILDGREAEVSSVVSNAYITHKRGNTALPRSMFLRFPNNASNRIIALPGLLGDAEPVAGIKWIASFPGNIRNGMDRASAIMAINSVETGRPYALLESSVISAKRTASSAALAAKTLHRKNETKLGLIGCGLINFEVVKHIKAAIPSVDEVRVYDTDRERARTFCTRLEHGPGNIRCVIAAKAADVYQTCGLVSIATTAGTPYADIHEYVTGESTVLHLSLRDITTQTILMADNIVDDCAHVLRERTSVDLAAKECGHHEFIRCELADVLAGNQPPRVKGKPVIFSPFGLGILDLAVARLVIHHAEAGNIGLKLDDFFPEPWWA